MNNEEAPAAAVDTAIPQASNKNGSALNAVRDRKLSVVSKQYDMDGDGELNEAEQASKFIIFLWLFIVIIVCTWCYITGDYCRVGHRE